MSHWDGKYTGSLVGRESTSRCYWVVPFENQHGLKARRWQLLMTLLWNDTGCPRRTRRSVERLLCRFNPSLLCPRACTWLTRWVCQNLLICNELQWKLQRHAGSDLFKATLICQNITKTQILTTLRRASNQDTAKEHLLTHNRGTGPELSSEARKEMRL